MVRREGWTTNRQGADLWLRAGAAGRTERQLPAEEAEREAEQGLAEAQRQHWLPGASALNGTPGDRAKSPGSGVKDAPKLYPRLSVS